MEFLLDRPYRVLGTKLTLSESFTNSKGTVIWDGENKQMLLGQFNNPAVALRFAENIKNNSPKKSWRIVVFNTENNLEVEIGYTEKEEYIGKKQSYFYQK